jgi:hypothetical protein
MQCNQLLRLVKEWYTHVQHETMAPARMMQFVDTHVKDCPVCSQDPALPVLVERIREYVLPDSKFPKPFRSPNSLTPDIFPSSEYESDDSEESDEGQEEDDSEQLI